MANTQAETAQPSRGRASAIGSAWCVAAKRRRTKYANWAVLVNGKIWRECVSKQQAELLRAHGEDLLIKLCGEGWIAASPLSEVAGAGHVGWLQEALKTIEQIESLGDDLQYGGDAPVFRLYTLTEKLSAFLAKSAESTGAPCSVLPADMSDTPPKPPELLATREACSLDGIVRRFRLLEHGDLIGKGDEFLDDDAETWKALPAMWWGTKCNYLILKPVRSKAPNARRVSGGSQPESNNEA